MGKLASHWCRVPFLPPCLMIMCQQAAPTCDANSCTMRKRLSCSLQPDSAHRGSGGRGAAVAAVVGEERLRQRWGTIGCGGGSCKPHFHLFLFPKQRRTGTRSGRDFAG